MGCATESLESDIIARCLPTGPGQRHNRLFQLARALKAIPRYATASPEDLYPVVDAWCERAEPFIRTKSLETNRAEFSRMWREVRTSSAGGFKGLVAAALAAPFPPEAEWYRGAQLHRLTAVCAALQRHAGGGPFFLSGPMAKDACGFASDIEAARGLKRLVMDGVIRLAQKAARVNGVWRSNSYRWCGWP
jgi:hypothetical protein